MPDATYGIVNSISWDDLKSLGTEAIVTNTLHLYLNYLDGVNLEKLKDDQFVKPAFSDFTGWKGGVLTDSGGFQAYSFIKMGLGKMKDDHLEFLSPKTKKKYFLTPELSVEIQLKLRSNAIVVLDDPLDPGTEKSRIVKSVHRTIEWAKICKSVFETRVKEIQDTEPEYDPLIFCVIQGGGDFELRKRCFEQLAEIGFDGYGFGGWPTDVNGKFLDELIEFNSNLVLSLPEKKFNYAMGVGNPDDIVKCLKWGYNLFDCVLPTRNARHGHIYVAKGEGEKSGENYDILRINSQRYESDNSPINSNSKIPELRNTSKKYLRYLYKIKDSNAFRISTLQNMEFYNSFFN